MGERDVLAALEAATLGSRELDEGIAHAVGWKRTGEHWTDHWISPVGDVRRDPPVYSVSIDAALTLVRKGDLWAATYLEFGPFGQVIPYREDGSFVGKVSEAYAATVPLALCIAALRARLSYPAASEEPGDG